MSNASITESDVIACVRDGNQMQHAGYQGNIHTSQVGTNNILVKSAAGSGVAAWLNRWMLQREYLIYRRLTGIEGIPHCYGFFLRRYLVLENVEARTMRHTTMTDRASFFAEMLSGEEQL